MVGCDLFAHYALPITLHYRFSKVFLRIGTTCGWEAAKRVVKLTFYLEKESSKSHPRFSISLI